jgi:hypothetical protein
MKTKILLASVALALTPVTAHAEGFCIGGCGDPRPVWHPMALEPGGGSAQPTSEPIMIIPIGYSGAGSDFYYSRGSHFWPVGLFGGQGYRPFDGPAEWRGFVSGPRNNDSGNPWTSTRDVFQLTGMMGGGGYMGYLGGFQLACRGIGCGMPQDSSGDDIFVHYSSAKSKGADIKTQTSGWNTTPQDLKQVTADIQTASFFGGRDYDGFSGGFYWLTGGPISGGYSGESRQFVGPTEEILLHLAGITLNAIDRKPPKEESKTDRLAGGSEMENHNREINNPPSQFMTGGWNTSPQDLKTILAGDSVTKLTAKEVDTAFYRGIRVPGYHLAFFAGDVPFTTLGQDVLLLEAGGSGVGVSRWSDISFSNSIGV